MILGRGLHLEKCDSFAYINQGTFTATYLPPFLLSYLIPLTSTSHKSFILYFFLTEDQA